MHTHYRKFEKIAKIRIKGKVLVSPSRDSQLSLLTYFPVFFYFQTCINVNSFSTKNSCNFHLSQATFNHRFKLPTYISYYKRLYYLLLELKLSNFLTLLLTYTSVIINGNLDVIMNHSTVYYQNPLAEQVLLELLLRAVAGSLKNSYKYFCLISIQVEFRLCI